MKKVFAFFLLVVGVGMICSGIFYDSILGLFDVKKIIEKTPSKLICIRKEESGDGFSTSETSKMYFDKFGLTKIEDSVVISPIDNTDESITKIAEYYKDMEEYINGDAQNTEGLKSNFEFATNRIKYTMNFDMKKLNENKGSSKKTNEAITVVDDTVGEVVEETKEEKKEIEFTSVDNDYKIRFNYHDSYKKVKAAREKANYTCS